jgi:rhodanese-related sulfurtransferase
MKGGNFLRILILTLALAGYSAWFLGQRERETTEVRPAGEQSVIDIPLLRLPEAEALWRQGSTLFVDVRSAADYGCGHIDGAVNVPDEEFEARLAKLTPRLERAKVIVVYCKSEDCGKSLWAALRLRQLGLGQTKIYPGGWNEWYLRQRPTASNSH